MASDNLPHVTLDLMCQLPRAGKAEEVGVNNISMYRIEPWTKKCRSCLLSDDIC
jgi:hypothetical protein